MAPRKHPLAAFFDSKESMAFSRETDQTKEFMQLLFGQQESDRGCAIHIIKANCSRM
jgi:hypothetical protein